MHINRPTVTIIFLSTLSLRRATADKHAQPPTQLISIHALLAESDVFLLRKITITVDISIHALLAESDILGNVVAGLRMSFLSTLSLRRATEFRKLLYPGSTNFYPRSPCGERQSFGNSCTQAVPISIHALLAESDGNCPSGCQRPCISIHALLAESDQAANGLANTPPEISIHALLAESDTTQSQSLSA